MSKTATILSAESERAQLVAQVILCSLATVCTVGVIWAVGQQDGKTGSVPRAMAPDNTVIAPEPEPVFTLPSVPPELTSSSIARESSILPPAAPFPQPAASITPPRVPAMPPTSLPPGRELKNPQIVEGVKVARLAREAGDTATALESLRAADLREPQHPEILSEMALTYEAMGLVDKAKALWRAILAMGEAQAGGYYMMAKNKMESIPMPSTPVNSSPIQLGDCEVLRTPHESGGERVTVRVPIVAAPGAVIDPGQMDIHVFLFEQVNDGERIEQVRAEAPQQRWASDPIDWTAPEGEILEITYDLAAPTPEELRNLGNRSFHGYIVKLFYQNKLSGEQSHPPTLQDFPPRSAPPAGLDNALFPK
ncbi:tetratricopeptide repeat protein [Phragmitibacter flavus]|uniref:Tetratricopeptide repeat protein n=1 Tax=Phragmitibacter flavus TaxID=2576071 RepID=A0A5R8KK65_9BACT|nr:tetratricopeptide repeat protein [Phragmitibacter flavus]TLD72009.1 tetratricopeptide repeat protein [Phragmitibacter flavus]